MSINRTPAKVSVTDLIIAPSRVNSVNGTIYRLDEEYLNHADDLFLKNEALVMFHSGQLARIGAGLCDPAIADYEITGET